MSDDTNSNPRPRLCHLLKWPDFNGYGFNLHAEKGKAGQFIGKIDVGSPAEAAGLKQGDRIVEVNGVNIGNENHQQVVSRIKAGGDETRLLVVDNETDQYYKDEKKVVKGDLPEVLYTKAEPRPSQVEEPSSEVVNDEIVEPPEPEPQEPEPEPEREPEPVVESVEPEVVPTTEVVTETVTTTVNSSEYHPRYCHLRKWHDFDGYGFNLHAEKDKPGQYIGKVDENSPAEVAHLKEGDRIIEVNDVNIESETHTQVIQRVKSGGDETRLLVVDKDTDQHYKSRGITVSSSLPEVERYETPKREVAELSPPVEVEQPEQVTVDAESSEIVETQEIHEDGIEAPPVEGISTTVEAETEVVADTEQVTEAVEAATVVETEVRVEDQVETSPEPVVNEINEVPESVPEPDSEPVSEPVVDETEAVEALSPEEPVVTTSVEEKHEDVVQEQENATVITVKATEAEEEKPPSATVNGQQTTVTTTHIPAEPAKPEVSSNAAVANGDPLVGLSAKEMRERLAQRKRTDPRSQKMDFRQKHLMFEKM